MPPKKDDKKPEGLTPLQQIILFLVIIAFLGAIWYRVETYFIYGKGITPQSLWLAIVGWFTGHVLPVIKVVGFIIVALCTWGIVHSYRILYQINKEDKEMYGPTAPAETISEVPVLKNERWERIIEHLNSVNASDWRLAIIEADVMLDELLKAQGYHGDSLGERLRSVDKSDFLTLDNAWEAHRVRNQVAHQGADFPLSEREAKRAIALYESVFKEFKII